MTIAGGNPQGVELTAEQFAALIGAAVASALAPALEKLDAISNQLASGHAETPFDGERV